MTTTRSEQLFAIVDRFNQIHRDWAEFDTNNPEPTELYWRALQAVLDTFEGGDLPADCRPMAAAVYKLAQERARYDASGMTTVPQSLFAAREELERVARAARSPLERPHRETIQELAKQNVPHEQIARIWGLRRPDGTGRADLVQQELNQPGSVIGPNYVHPEDRMAHDQVLVERRNWQALEVLSQKEQERIEADQKPCPETPRELWLIGVSTAQAARMLRQPQEQVARLWDEFEREKVAIQTAQERPAPVAPPAPAVVTPPPVAEAATADPLDDMLGAAGDSPYAQFDGWSEQELRIEAKRLGIRLRGRFTRETLMDRILAADPTAELVDDDSVAGVDEFDHEGVTVGETEEPT